MSILLPPMLSIDFFELTSFSLVLYRNGPQADLILLLQHQTATIYFLYIFFDFGLRVRT